MTMLHFLAAEHHLNALIKEQISTIENQKGKFQFLLQRMLVENWKNMRYLWRVVPIPWQNSELLPRVLANVVNWKGLTFVDIVEVVYYLGHLLGRYHLFVTPDHLREGHLAHPDHATPTCVRYVGALQVVVELWETRTVSEPRSVQESVVKQLVLLLVVLRGNGDGLTQEMDAIPRLGKTIFGALVKKSQHSVPHVETGLDNLLESSETTRLLNHNIM